MQTRAIWRKAKRLTRGYLALGLAFGPVLGLGLAAGACGPTLSLLEVDVRQPAEQSLPLEGREAAFFVAQYSPNVDSVFRSLFTQGLRSQWAAETGQPEEAIGVFHHYPLAADQEPEAVQAYCRSLAQEVEARDLLFLVDSVYTGSFVNDPEIPYRDYTISGVTVPYHAVLRIYDAARDSLLHVDRVHDTIAWEVVKTKSGEVQVPKTAFEDLCKVSGTVATRTLGQYFDQWETQDRLYFDLPGKEGKAARLYVKQFNWTEAQKIWLDLLPQASRETIPCLAFNLALAAEMQGDFSLAQDWLTFSKKYGILTQTPFYERILQERITETRHLKNRKIVLP